mgnify:CR=1 FL=1
MRLLSLLNCRDTLGTSGSDVDRTVIVTVVTMRVMQMSSDQIVDMVTMRDSLVTTVRPVNMTLVVFATLMIRRTSGRIRAADLQNVLDNLAVLLLVVEVPIMKKVGVTIVLDGGMTAVGPMLMIVVCVSRGHGFSFVAEVT